VVPLKPQSLLFGKDIVICDSLNLDQGEVAICSAFNGWLYAIVTYYDSINEGPGAYLLRSIDNGITWTNLYGGSYSSNGGILRSNNIVAIGDSNSNLKVFWSTIYSDTPSDLGGGYVYRFNGITGDFEAAIFVYADGLSSIAIASDYNYQAFGSTHPTLGMVCSTLTQVAFHSSSNGGISFDNSQLVATTSTYYFHKVALNYGRSPSWSTGRYFAAWEAQASQTSTIGHIYSAHSEPDFNSSFTTPVCIDSIDPSAINKVRNPAIACQFSSADNDSSSLTEVIMLEKQLSPNNYDTRGFYNLQATTSNHFGKFSISSSTNNKTQPDINFNPYNSTFMLTYYDFTLRSLPFLTNDVNLVNPDSWNVISPAYNDNGNLVLPLPKVNLNFVKQAGMDTYTSEGTNGHGIALFDAPYSTYTGVSGHSTGTSAKLNGTYPNPCSTTIRIAFELKDAGIVTIDVMDIMGQTLGTVTDQVYSPCKHVVKYDVSNLPDGNYLYRFRSGDITITGKFIVIR
jgi:hypothetical protein